MLGCVSLLVRHRKQVPILRRFRLLPDRRQAVRLLLQNELLFIGRCSMDVKTYLRADGIMKRLAILDTSPYATMKTAGDSVQSLISVRPIVIIVPIENTEYSVMKLSTVTLTRKLLNLTWWVCIQFLRIILYSSFVRILMTRHVNMDS